MLSSSSEQELPLSSGRLPSLTGQAERLPGGKTYNFLLPEAGRVVWGRGQVTGEKDGSLFLKLELERGGG